RDLIDKLAKRLPWLKCQATHTFIGERRDNLEAHFARRCGIVRDLICDRAVLMVGRHPDVLSHAHPKSSDTVQTSVVGSHLAGKLMMSKTDLSRRAVEYVRMSTEHQRYSITNQRSAIATYAEGRGYELIRSYEDAGKSGLTLKGRDGLQRLLADTLGPTRDFSAIIVLDVSRWGRFQDPDQAAHYEFLCRQAGVRVIYCAEPFVDDFGPMTSVLKNLKRVMAAEYSRELSVKLSRARLQQARLGFRQGSPISYGFRRQLVS